MMKSIFKTFFLSLCIIANTHFAYGQTASILPPAKTQFLDNNGKPLTSGTVDFYIPSTTTRKTTWQNSGETVINTNPVVLDAGGRALIYGDGVYRQVVKDRLGTIIWDQLTSSTGSGSTPSTSTGDGDLVGTMKPWAGITAPNQYMFTYGQEVSRTTYATLFTAITSTQAVFCTSGSPILSGVADTTNFWVGMTVELSCVAPGFTTIISKTASSVTLAVNSNVSTNVNAVFFPWGNGNHTTTFNLPDFRGIVPAGNNNMGGVASSNLTTTYFGTTDPNSIGALGGSQFKTFNNSNVPTLATTNFSTAAVSVTSPDAFNVFATNGVVSSNAGGGIFGQLASTGSNGIRTITSTGTAAINAITTNTNSGGLAIQAVVAAVGSGYTPGSQTITVSGGTCTTQPQFTVTVSGGGAFSGSPVLLTAGSCTVVPTNPASTTGGGGTGGTLNVNYSAQPFSLIQPTKTTNIIIKVTPDSNSATASGVTSLGSMTGDIACGSGLLCTGNNISVITISQTIASTSTIATLKALVGGVYPTIDVQGYFTLSDGGGGLFVWDSANVTADNAGTIIAPNAGGTGRWIRQLNIPNQILPEMFGAKADGSNDDAANIRAAMIYLNGLSTGGTIQLSCGKTYTGSSISADARSMIQLLSNVNINGCGRGSVIKVANGVNTSSAFFVWALYTTGTVNNAVYSNFDIDMNGVNNSCGGTCYHSNAALGVATGTNLTASNIWFKNNPGSNNTVFGTNVTPSTVSNLKLINNVHSHNGDAVNAASTDFSGDFFIADNVTISNIVYSDGPTVNGSAFELHGVNVNASNLSVTNHFNCGIIASEPSGSASLATNINLGLVSCTNVKGGIQVYSKAGSTDTNINISKINVNFLSGSSGVGVDACSNMSATSVTNTNLTIDGVVIKSDVTTNLGNETAGVSACRWVSILIRGIQATNTQGPGVLIDNVSTNAVIGVYASQFTNPGRTTTAANQVAVRFINTSGNTASNINIQNVVSSGTIVNNISGNVNSTAGYIIGNQGTGVSGSQVSWTGTGTFTYTLPASNAILAGTDVAQTFTALQRFTDNDLALVGSTSGTVVLRAPAIAASSVIRFPSGSTDFSATGPGVLQQASTGSAITVGQHNTYSQLTFAAGNLNPMLQNQTWFFAIGTNVATENIVAMPMSQVATIDKMYCSSNAAPGGAAQTFILTARKNASDQTVTCTMTTGGASTCNDTTHSFAVAAGDLVSMKAVLSATSGTANGMNCGLRLTVLSP